MAFNSVEHIMRDVIFGWVIIDIYTHNGASFFFIVVYLHHVPRLYYGSYSIYAHATYYGQSELLYFSSWIYYRIFSYVLPWGQMIILGCYRHLQLGFYNSGIGEKLVTLLWGGY